MKRTTLNCALYLLACALAPVIVANAKAATPEQNYNLISDFIESDRKCEKDAAACQHVKELCVFMDESRVRELYNYMRHEYPFKTKNGGMNIAARFSRALRKCE